jgi:hypothetical protein
MKLCDFVLCAAALAMAGSVAIAGPAQDAASYAGAVAKINDAHARQPGKNREADLAKQIPPAAKSALKRVVDANASPELAPALLKCGEAALDLDQMADFEAVRNKLAAVSPADAAKLGAAVSRPRFIARGIGEFQAGWLDGFADACDAVLAAYDEVFGFAEFSKIPGKKLRFRVHLEPAITKPPHFAPEFPWHSEVDFPVADGAQFSSPTPQGHFLFYGLCHELGHVIAMWGDLKNMEDKHAWAHYTGVVIVEHLAQKAKDQPWMARLKDVRWRSLKAERELPDNKTLPSAASYNGVMAMLIALHDSAGPKAIGTALNQMDAQKKCRRINHVRYYSFADFQKALTAAAPDKKKEIDPLFRAAKPPRP